MGKVKVFTIREHIIDASHIRDYARATADTQDAVLKLHVKQYTPRDNPMPRKGDVTIIGAHATAFPKETYEPLWDELHQQLSRLGIRIRNVWIADAAWQGQSGVLNQQEHLLGNEPSWYDYSRDMLHMINTFRPPRPLVAIGHSFGASALTHTAVLHPRLFHSMILLEPVITRFHSTSLDSGRVLATMSAQRRDVWPSRSAAAASFAKSPFLRAWDARAFDCFVKHGLRAVTPTPTTTTTTSSIGTSSDSNSESAEKETVEEGPVTLTTTKHQEVFTFLRPSWPAFDDQGQAVVDASWLQDLRTAGGVELRPYPFYRAEAGLTFLRLPNVRPGVKYILGGTSQSVQQEDIDERLAITGTGLGGSGGAEAEGRVEQVSHATCGHLVPMEDPGYCAREAAVFISKELRLWAEQERTYEEWVASGTSDDKVRLTEDWMRHLGIKEKPASKM